jgi:hypothetical protein
MKTCTAGQQLFVRKAGLRDARPGSPRFVRFAVLFHKLDVRSGQFVLRELHHLAAGHGHDHGAGGRVVGLQFSLEGLRSIGAGPHPGL